MALKMFFAAFICTALLAWSGLVDGRRVTGPANCSVVSIFPRAVLSPKPLGPTSQIRAGSG